MMLDMQIVNAAVDTFGESSQVVVAIEEMSELQKELCKLLRGEYHIDDMAEEMADVEIMLAQLKVIFANDINVERWKAKKLERLVKRIEAFTGEKSASVFPLSLPQEELERISRERFLENMQRMVEK